MVSVKKGQMEMVGLLIIVVLLVVIGLIAISFYFNKPGKESDGIYTLKANNLMNTIDKFTLADGDGGELIKECCLNTQKCEELASFIENEPDFANLDEKFSLFVNDAKVAGNCDFGVSSSSFTYGVECSSRVSICK